MRSLAVVVAALLTGASLVGSSQAIETDGVTGLPTDVTSIVSVAGMWTPVDDQYVNANCNGTLANTWQGNFVSDPTGRENMVIIGWQYCGFNNGATSTIPVHLALLRQQADGTLKLDTESFVSDSLTSGGSSVVISDFNGDGYADIFLAAHNESPLIAMPSTALLSNGSGGFQKVTLNDRVMAHNADVAFVNGVPTVITKTFLPGDMNPMYQFKNGSFTQLTPTRLSSQGNGDNAGPNGASIVLAQFAGAGKYEMVFGDFNSGPGYPFVAPPKSYCDSCSGVQRIASYTFTGGDIGTAPLQLMDAYYNARPQYANVPSYFGPGNTHTFKMRVDDFNHDGSPDIIAIGMLWDFPSNVNSVSGIQMLQNDGTGHFSDVSDTFASNLNLENYELDHNYLVRDLDNSGIASYESSVHIGAQSNYLAVNDGSGQLHVALMSQLAKWSDAVNKAAGGLQTFSQVPKFVAYRTPNGKVNFLAITPGPVTKNGVSHQVYALVNIPVQLDLAKQYTAPMTVKNRNGSHLIRTFAGDDTIYSGNNGGYSHVDGGLGNNKVIYAGPRANYTISQNGDGSWTIVDNKGADGADTLVHVQTAQFTDIGVTLSSTPPALRGGAVFSTAQSASQSFLRFLNTGSSAGTVTVTLRDYASGQSLGTWTSPSIPPLSEQQFAISSVESGANITGAKPAYYSIDAQAGFTGEFQHVLFRPADGTLTNLSTCQSIVTADPTTIAGVHTSILASGFPSSVAITNTGTVAAAATLDIYDARNGTKLGTYTSASIPASAQVIATVASLETAAGFTPTSSMYHYVIKARTPFTGFLQNLVNNTAVSVVTDMTTACSLNGVASTVAAPILSDGAVFSSAQSSSQSFLRFFNTGASDGTVTVTLKDYATGQTIGSWTSPDIAALSEQQFAISTVEAAAGVGATKPQYYSISVRSNIAGYFQHVLWRPADGTLTNLSTCGAGVSTDPAQVSGVHTSTVGSGFPSSIVINNTGAAAESVALDVYDAATGNKLGTYTSALIPPAAQAVVNVTDIETAAQITPTSSMFHYVLKAKPGFTGFLQHLVNNTKVGVITDMTTACALAIAGA